MVKNYVNLTLIRPAASASEVKDHVALHKFNYYYLFSNWGTVNTRMFTACSWCLLNDFIMVVSAF